MITLKLDEQDFWKLVNSLEDAAFTSLHSAKDLQTTGYYGADETAEKRIKHAHGLFSLANALKAQASQARG